MQSDWIVRRGATDLVILALGWASDPRVVGDFDSQGCDLLCLYDYRSIEPLRAEAFDVYRSIRLVAWSFGVWAAGKACARLPLSGAVALCGTPRPVDERCGIPPRTMQVTLDGIRREGIELFCRRAYGNACQHFEQGVPCDRPLDQLLDELQSLYDCSMADSEAMESSPLNWASAVVGGRDRIFPPEHQLNYWGDRATLRPAMGHYPFDELKRLTDIFLPNNS